MSPDLIMLFVCIAIALIGVVAAAVAFRRGNTGRMVQAGAVVLLPIALYFTGLLRLIVEAATSVGVWAATLALSPLVWIGFGLLAVTVVLWVVGGFVARRHRDRVIAGTAKPATGRGGSAPAVGTGSSGSTGSSGTATTRPAGKRGGKPAAPVDEDMAEIEALLKRRGID